MCIRDSEYRVLRANLVERAVKFLLRRKLLDDGFHNNIAILEIVEALSLIHI